MFLPIIYGLRLLGIRFHGFIYVIYIYSCLSVCWYWNVGVAVAVGGVPMSAVVCVCLKL